MKSRYSIHAIVIGLLFIGVASLGAWSGRREAPAEPVSSTVDLDAGSIVLEGKAVDWAVSEEWDITKTRNAQVDKWIDFLRGRNRDRTQLWLERSGKYGPLIQSSLHDRGMPRDLLYLALIESGLSPAAHSRASAVGMWQFIAETGRRYGLEIGAELDERRDPMRSTEAALAYLQYLHGRFGSWYLAAAAYNTGENRVGRIMRETFGRERGKDADFWRIAPRLPRETRDYVPLMLAAAFIAKDPAKYGFNNLNYQAPLAFDVALVSGPTSLETVARAAGVDIEAVRDLNPHLVQDRTPNGRGWWVRLPQGTEPSFTQNFPSAYRAEQQRLASARYHVVGRGENLTVLARRYSTSIRELQSWNGLGNRNLIKVGQRLRVSP